MVLEWAPLCFGSRVKKLKETVINVRETVFSNQQPVRHCTGAEDTNFTDPFLKNCTVPGWI